MANQLGPRFRKAGQKGRRPYKAITIRLDIETHALLTEVSHAEDRSRVRIVNRAVQLYAAQSKEYQASVETPTDPNHAN